MNLLLDLFQAMQMSVYNKPFNESFIRKFEAVKYNANLVITGAIRGTYRERLYHEFGLESLKGCK